MEVSGEQHAIRVRGNYLWANAPELLPLGIMLLPLCNAWPTS